MDPYKLHIRIGDNEFNAEGEASEVREAYAAFLDALRTSPVPQPKPVAPASAAAPGKKEEVDPVSSRADGPSAADLEKIMAVDGRLVSLTALPTGENREVDAVYLLLLGHRELRSEHQVTGATIMEGLRHSGLTVDRVDRLMEEAVGVGRILRSGQRRAVRYRLSNTGLTWAQAIAREVLDMVV